MVSPPAFVGRRRGLSALAEALATPPALVLVEGEAGIGKSRLLREFAASPARTTQGLWVAGACPPFREPYTLGPVVDTVRQATDRVAGLGLSDLAGALRPLFPEWGTDLPPAPEPAEDARAARHRLFRALTELFGCLDVAVLVVEDVHWADDATLEFLLFIASCQPQPFSLVVTYRPEDVPADSLLLRLSSRLPAGTTRTRLTLGPLDVDETGELVSSMLMSERLSVDFAAFVHQRTDGVPLAVEETVRLMYERADVARSGGRWVRRHLRDIDVPPTVRDAVLERSRRLGEEALAMLRADAVLADPAGEEMLVAVSGLAADRARAGLAEALECGLLQEDERGLVSFRHGLAARAVYEAISGPQRRAMHLRAGQALKEMSLQPMARLVRHFREAGDTDTWARHAEQAADVAIAADDCLTAAALLHDLLSNADLPPAAVAPLAAKIPTGSLAGTSRVHDVVRVLKSALASGVLDAGQAAMTRYQLALTLEGIDAFDEGHRAMELAIPDLPDGSLERVRGMAMLGWARNSGCPGQVHREWLRRAAEAARSVPAVHKLDLTEEIAIALLLLDEPEGWELASSIPDDVSTPAQRRNVTRRDLNLAEMAMRWGRHAEARRRAANALELAERYGYPRYRELILATELHLDWFTGNWNGLLGRAADLADNEDTLPTNQLQARLVTGLLLGADGRYAEAESALERVPVQKGDLGGMESMVESAAALARLHLATGRPEEALRVTAEPIAVVALKETWLWASSLAPARADALVTVGRLDEAADLVAAFSTGLSGRDAPAAQAALVLCEGILAAGRGTPEHTATVFARAADAFATLPQPYDALLARERRARCLLAAGRREPGLSLLAEVRTGLSELGARAAAGRVLDILKELGADAPGPRRRGRPGYGDRLSPREIEVVRLLVDGRTNRQIAETLVVSPQTVTSHVRSAMRKLRVSSRTALAVSVLELGLFGDERASEPDD
ncbi:MAG: helix-turn-helix transcriptional regulator [Actinoallomurus sp.]